MILKEFIKLKMKKALILLIGMLIYSEIQYSQDIENFKKLPKVEIKGNVSLNFNSVTTSDSSIIINPNVYSIAISPNLKIGELSLPFHFKYSNSKSAYTLPFLRYGIAPKYKKIKLYLGNNNISFSRYAFSGLNVFGAGFEFTPSNFYIGAFIGKCHKKRFIDSTDVNYSRLSPKYDTNCKVIKLGYKSGKRSILISYMNAEDDASSLPYFNPKFSLVPRKNKAIGGELSLRFLKKLAYNFNGGISIFTRNRNFIDIDTLLQNSGEKPIPTWVRNIEANPNLSTQLLYGYDQSLAFNSKTLGLVLRQKRIQPEYKSLGIQNVNSDLSQYSIETTIKVLKNKIISNFIVGKQRNNLNGKLLTQNSNNIFSANLNIIPNQKLNLNINYSNFGFRNNATANLPDDSLSFQNISNNLNINAQYIFENGSNGTKTLNLTFSNQKVTELNEANILFDKTLKNIYTNFNYSASETGKRSYMAGVNYNNSYSIFLANQGIEGNVESYGVSVSYSHYLFKEKLILTIGNNLNMASTEETEKKLAYSIHTSASYSLTKITSITTSFAISKLTIGLKDINQKYFTINLQNNF